MKALEKRLPRAVLAWAGLVAGLSAGCADGTARPSLAVGLQSESASERIRASVQAGQEQDLRAVPLLVERLEDSSADVRLFAIRALEKITGQTLGYRYFAPAQERAEAVQRWREWLKARRAAEKEG